LTNDLFKRIGAAATRFGRSVYGLPAQKAIVETRKLVGFSLLGADYVLPLNEVNEILELPPCTKLPRVKSWVRGLANVRGRLLPIVNFADFLGGTLSSSIRDLRVLVLDIDGVYVGIVVDRVQGIRSVAMDRYQSQLNESALGAFTDGSFIIEDNITLPLFSPRKLIQDNQFMAVSV